MQLHIGPIKPTAQPALPHPPALPKTALLPAAARPGPLCLRLSCSSNPLLSAARPSFRSCSSLRPAVLHCHPHGRWRSASPCLPPPLEVRIPARTDSAPPPPLRSSCPNALFVPRVAGAVVTGPKNRPKKPRPGKLGAEPREENPQLSEHDDGPILFFLRWVL